MQVHGGRIPVQRIDGVGVGEQLREERLKDVGEVWWIWGEKDYSQFRIHKTAAKYKQAGRAYITGDHRLFNGEHLSKSRFGKICIDIAIQRHSIKGKKKKKEKSRHSEYQIIKVLSGKL